MKEIEGNTNEGNQTTEGGPLEDTTDGGGTEEDPPPTCLGVVRMSCG